MKNHASSDKLPISAMIVGYNEGTLLSKCLESLSFCDDITYFDLHSDDNSLEIARNLGVKIVEHERVPYVEILHAKYLSRLKHKWVLFIDPDELLSFELIIEINYFFKKDEKVMSSIGAIMVPITFYFKEKPLIGTPWGNGSTRILIAHTDRFIFSGDVHQGRKIMPEYIYHEIKFNGKNVLHHFWMQSFSQLLSKHLRYLKSEGIIRFKNGDRTTGLRLLKTPFRQFKFSYIIKSGNKDGLTGFILSLFWAWYQTSAEFSLYKHQKNTPYDKN